MKRSLISSFLHRVRIHGGEVDASARAMHRKAALENVSGATIERKIMSTKTTFKRVALVAVAALGVGMLSAVPSNAAPSFGAGTYGTFGTSTITQVVGGQASTVATLDANTITNIAVTGVGSIVSSAVAGTGNVQTRTTGATTWSDSTTAAGGTDTIVISSSVAGTTTITATPLSANGTPGAAVTQTITWGAAAALSGQYSTAFIGKVGNTFPTADATVSAPVTTNQFAANIGLTLKDSNNVALTGQSVSVTVSGPGLLGIQAGSTSPAISTTVPAVSGRAVSLSATAMAAASTATINVYGDGTAGTSTITVTAGGLTYTKTITFYGNAATTTATQALYIAKAGTALGAVGAVTAPVGDTVAHTVAVTGIVKDAAGNAVTGATVKVVSSNTSVITAGSCVEETTDAPGTYGCQVYGAVGAASGSTATVTFEVLNTTTSAYDITAAPLTFTIGGAISSMVLTTNASSYAPLAPVTLTVTAKDSAGYFAYDQDATLIASLVSSTQLGGTLASPIKLVNGVGSKTGLYAPSISGDFTVSGTDNVSTAGEAVSVTATVAGGDTSAAVDAANAATDAANYAADAADAATTAAQEATAAAQAAQDSADAATAAVVALGLRVNVLMASVRAQLTSLSNLLVRIIKKTKA